MSKNSERLKEERLRLGKNQAEFGGIGGVSRDVQAGYESGRSDMRTSYLSALAVTGVDVLYILTGQRTPGIMREEGEVVWKPEEIALLKNYRHSPLEARRNLQAVAAAFARRDYEEQGQVQRQRHAAQEQRQGG